MIENKFAKTIINHKNDRNLIRNLPNKTNTQSRDICLKRIDDNDRKTIKWLPAFIPLFFLLCYAVLSMDFVTASAAFFLAILIAAGTNIPIFRYRTFASPGQKEHKKSKSYIDICIYSAILGLFLSISLLFFSHIGILYFKTVLSVPIFLCLSLSCFTLGMLILFRNKKVISK
jgi:cation transport ATPase